MVYGLEGRKCHHLFSGGASLSFGPCSTSAAVVSAWVVLRAHCLFSLISFTDYQKNPQPNRKTPTNKKPPPDTVTKKASRHSVDVSLTSKVTILLAWRRKHFPDWALVSLYRAMPSSCSHTDAVAGLCILLLLRLLSFRSLCRGCAWFSSGSFGTFISSYLLGLLWQLAIQWICHKAVPSPLFLQDVSFCLREVSQRSRWYSSTLGRIHLQWASNPNAVCKPFSHC